MFRTRIAVTSAAVIVGFAGLCAAQTAGDAAKIKEDIKPLTIGDKARDIDIAHWVKPGVLADEEGKFTPLTSFEQDKVYVLEFWATWCSPCVASMSHLSKCQEKYADYDVTFIGVSDEPLPTVVSFLFENYKKDGKIQNDRTRYTLTTDPDESVKRDYFRAAGQRGIPCAFIIGKDSRIEWIGHPMDIDEPLDKVVKDNWDRDEFKADWEKKNAAERERRELMEDFGSAVKDGNWAKAHAAAATITERCWDDPSMLNMVAWEIVDNESNENPDLDLALKAARRANELTEGNDPAVLDTVARVYYEKGDLDKAIEYQTKAVKLAGDDPMGEEIKATLEKYKAEKK